VAIAPGSALGWARLSYANARFASQAQEGVESALVRAREAVATAMALDDALAEVPLRRLSSICPLTGIGSLRRSPYRLGDFEAAQASQQQLLSDCGDGVAWPTGTCVQPVGRFRERGLLAGARLRRA